MVYIFTLSLSLKSTFKKKQRICFPLSLLLLFLVLLCVFWSIGCCPYVPWAILILFNLFFFMLFWLDETYHPIWKNTNPFSIWPCQLEIFFQSLYCFLQFYDFCLMLSYIFFLYWNSQFIYSFFLLTLVNIFVTVILNIYHGNNLIHLKNFRALLCHFIWNRVLCFFLLFDSLCRFLCIR